MKEIEVYKGFSILEADGDWLAAGYKYKIDINPGSRHRFLGVMSLEKARKEIDWMAEVRGGGIL